MQRPEEELIRILKNSGIDFTVSLPCEKIKALLEMLPTAFQHVHLTREEEGVGICAGAALSGRRPAMFLQSSGIGNMINALLSLTAFYELPLALFVSRRGIYKERIDAQLPMGLKLPGILSGAGISWTEINTVENLRKVAHELPTVYAKNGIHAFLMSPAIWEGSDCGSPHPASTGANAGAQGMGRLAPGVDECERARAGSAECGVQDSTKNSQAEPCMMHPTSRPALTRYEIIKIIGPYLDGKAVICNLGIPSKELYAVKHQPSNFYMLGSMGMATPIGLGIALTSEIEVVVLDGDGSLLMNPGTLATAACVSPKNLTIIAIDNGAHGSTGSQATATRKCVDLEKVARGFGIRNTVKAARQEDISAAIKAPREALAFIHALAVPGNSDAPNVPLHHLDIRRQVQDFLKLNRKPDHPDL